jgi:hypothetical protein
MNAMTAVLESSAEKWRTHCQQHPDRFRALRGTATARKRTERFEEQLIDQLHRDDLPPMMKAVAFRSIVELRGSTGRDVATFFAVEPRVVVLGLSLLELPAQRAAHVSPAAAVSVDGVSRTRAA